MRVGDKTSIAASVSNMTGKPQSGTVSMILFDPVTEKVVDTQKQKFSVEAGKTIGDVYKRQDSSQGRRSEPLRRAGQI